MWARILCGKVEAGIPEDDIRNPAVIADNVGDNVGDVAGMGADLYESYVGSVLSASALGAFAGLGDKGFWAPFILAVAGVLASIVGTFFVRTGEKADQKQLLSALRKGVYVAGGIILVAAFFIIRFLLGDAVGNAAGRRGLYRQLLGTLRRGALRLSGRRYNGYGN